MLIINSSQGMVGEKKAKDTLGSYLLFKNNPKKEKKLLYSFTRVIIPEDALYSWCDAFKKSQK